MRNAWQPICALDLAPIVGESPAVLVARASQHLGRLVSVREALSGETWGASIGVAVEWGEGPSTPVKRPAKRSAIKPRENVVNLPTVYDDPWRAMETDDARRILETECRSFMDQLGGVAELGALLSEARTVFLAAFADWKPNSGANFESYLKTCLRRRLIDMLRANARKPVSVEARYASGSEIVAQVAKTADSEPVCRQVIALYEGGIHHYREVMVDLLTSLSFPGVFAVSRYLKDQTDDWRLFDNAVEGDDQEWSRAKEMVLDAAAEIIEALASGYRVDQIADQLDLPPRSVNLLIRHMGLVMGDLGVRFLEKAIQDAA